MMKLNAKIILGLVAAVTLVLGTGCGKKEEQIKGIKIGVSLYDAHDTFIAELMNEFNNDITEEANKQGITISVETEDSEGSQAKQNSAVQRLIEQKACDILCVNLVDRTNPTAIIDAAQQHDIPVIFFNRELVEGDLERWNKLYYVGADARQSGIYEGELAAEAFLENPSYDKNGDGVIQYVMFEGEAGHQDSIVRTETSVGTLMEKKLKVDKLSSVIANWNRAQASSKMSTLIEEFGDEIELVLANNDDMALGVIDAYNSAHIMNSKRPVIVGIDGTNDGKNAVKAGDMYGTVYNDKEGQAKAMIDLITALAVKKDTSEIQFTNGRYIRLPYVKISQQDMH
ncbi:monosaccharide ABC transporter substrate-binding protein, CUT2 family [Lachnospiraceae bacterium KH1T2]|nr:monosaccharide ABC transporter substrate-binding protein, CUT2 family [Lachnospiraceae bacterium KH1T2]